ncbi:MAG: hypothetical protein H0X62_13435 [Bacteroidetes bacterium]|nr:hypothetical protein [Bacteroidota bacterium]
MTREQLQANIIATIKENENGEITAELMQERLLEVLAWVAILGQDAGLITYDSTRTYKPGECVIYLGQIFKAIVAATGAFNLSHWQLVSATPFVETITERNSLPYRFEGIEVFVKATKETYRLIGGIAPANWVITKPNEGTLHTITSRITVTPTREYLLYGDLTIEEGAVFVNDGRTVLLQGDVVLNGDLENNGTLIIN